MSDFYTLFNYSKAFRDGVNPYSTEVMQHEEYIVPRSAAPFSPFAFVSYLPLTVMPLKMASIVFFVINWLLLGVLAFCCIKMGMIRFDWGLLIWIHGFLVLSRPGHMTLFTGYFTVLVALGVVVALHFSKTDKPWLAGIGFLFASVKPTYAIPLTILMLARRDFRAAAWGVGLTSLFAIGGFFWLASHSDFASVVSGIESGQQAFHDDATEEPFNTWTRIDVAGLAAKVTKRVPGTVEYLITMVPLLVVPCVALWKIGAFEKESRYDSGAGGLSALIVVLTVLLSIYHHSYDCLVMVVSMIALLLSAHRYYPEWPRLVTIGTGFLMLIPMLNYLSTRAARNALGFEQSDLTWQLITMINGLVLITALIIAIHFAFKRKAAIHPESGSG